jgi:hypothetical protein
MANLLSLRRAEDAQHNVGEAVLFRRFGVFPAGFALSGASFATGPSLSPAR